MNPFGPRGITSRQTRILLPAAFLLIFLSACSGRRSEPLRGSLNVRDPKVNRGQLVYMGKCDKCHPGGDAGLGPSLNNKPLPGFLIGFQARHGLGAMPAFKEEEVSQSELQDIEAYMKALRRNG